MFWLHLLVNWFVELRSKRLHRQTLQRNQLSNIVEQQPKIVLICKDQKTNETYIVSIEKKSAKE